MQTLFLVVCYSVILLYEADPRYKYCCHFVAARHTLTYVRTDDMHFNEVLSVAVLGFVIPKARKEILSCAIEL
jgi:hypothetical protein